MDFKIFNLGLIKFESAWKLQKELLSQVAAGTLPGALILCRHHPVITLGRLAGEENILVPPEVLKARGIEVRGIERGGDVTYHGPGQLVAYPIFNLNLLGRDLHLFLRQLEEAALEFLSAFGLYASRLSGKTGVWIGTEKIVSVGISVKNWVSFHGLSINIKAKDLENFSLIRPCGLDIKMTALETVLGRGVQIEGAGVQLVEAFNTVFRKELACQPR